jgi:hypothetical protein
MIRLAALPPGTATWEIRALRYEAGAGGMIEVRGEPER